MTNVINAKILYGSTRISTIADIPAAMYGSKKTNTKTKGVLYVLYLISFLITGIKTNAWMNSITDAVTIHATIVPLEEAIVILNKLNPPIMPKEARTIKQRQ